MVLPDGDEVVLGDEDVDLGEVIPALPGDTVTDQVDDIAEVLHLGSLAEFADSFDRQGVQVEVIAQQRDTVRIGLRLLLL